MANRSVAATAKTFLEINAIYPVMFETGLQVKVVICVVVCEL